MLLKKDRRKRLSHLAASKDLQSGGAGVFARLIAALLLAGPVTAAVPTPKSHFGHEIGADRTVLDWDRVVSYFRALETSSPRIKVQELGKPTEGRPLIAAIISA